MLTLQAFANTRLKVEYSFLVHCVDGWGIESCYRQSAGTLCHDGDDGLPQLEVIGAFSESENQGLVTHEMGQVATAQGCSKKKRVNSAKKSGNFRGVPNLSAIMTAIQCGAC